jgi:hypothetical protein
MPTYRYRSPSGRLLTVDGPEPPTPQELADIYRAAEEDAQQAPVPRDTLMGRVGQGLAHGGKAVLEGIGRPLELVTGTIAGTMDKGLSEGLARGWRAFTESEFANSKIQENTDRLLQEQGILAGSPRARAVAGFVGDMLLDPTNLLGAPGLVRRGLMKAADAAGAGAAARTALTAPNRAWSAGVVEPGSALLRTAAAKTPGVRRLIEAPELVGVRGIGDLDAQQQKILSSARLRAAQDQVGERVETLFADLTPAQQKTVTEQMSLALADPTKASPAYQAVQADPRLATLFTDLQDTLSTTRQEEVLAGLMPDFFAVNTKKFTRYLQKLTPAQQQSLSDHFTAGTPLANKSLQRFAASIRRQISSQGGTKELLYDPTSFRFGTSRTGRRTVEFSTLAQNYVPIQGIGRSPDTGATVFRPFGTALKEAKRRTLSFTEAARTPDQFETDIKKIVTKRLLSSARAQESARYLDELATTMGSTSPKAGLVQLPDNIKNELKDLPALQPLSNYYFPEAVASDLAKTVLKLSDAETMETIFGRSLKLFKTLVTSFDVPRYPLTNYLGNVANMHLAGMGPDQIAVELRRASKAVLPGTVDTILSNPTSKTVFKHPTLTDAQILTLARDNNIIGRSSGFASEFIEPDQLKFGAKLLTGKYNPLNPEFLPYRKSRELGQRYIEDPAKLALFVHELRQGQNIDNASLTVKKFLFDYGQLSDFERQYLVGAIPFYTWTRKNVPLQIASLIARPGKVNTQNRLVSVLGDVLRDEEVGGEEIDERRLPSRLTDPGTFALGSQMRGRVRLPIYDVSLPGRMLAEPRTVLDEMLNPGIKTAIAALPGSTDLITGAPIDDSLTRPTPLALGLSRLGLPTVAETVSGPRQTRRARALTEQLPVPTLARLAMAGLPEGATQTVPLVAGALAGLSPTEITPRVQTEGRKERMRTRGERLRRMGQSRTLSALEALTPEIRRYLEAQGRK